MRAPFPRLHGLASFVVLGALVCGAASAWAQDPPPAGAAATAQSGAMCPAKQGSRAVAGDAQLRSIRSQLALQQGGAPTPDAPGQALNASGYNYGGDAGSVSLPGAMNYDAQIQR